MIPQQNRHKVLIVDDAPSVREALRYALDDESDLQVVGEASDGLTAIEHASKLAPDVVILDIELPKRDGYTVARSLKKLPHPPVVIFLSVHGDASSRQRGTEAGGDGFVEKGSGWAALIEQIRGLSHASDGS
jgi:DNA-binding NarL/FixJ family response regulator